MASHCFWPASDWLSWLEVSSLSSKYQEIRGAGLPPRDSHLPTLVHQKVYRWHCTRSALSLKGTVFFWAHGSDSRLPLKKTIFTIFIKLIFGFPVLIFSFTAHGALGSYYITVFIQYYSVICRPSDHTVGPAGLHRVRDTNPYTSSHHTLIRLFSHTDDSCQADSKKERWD